MESRLRLREHEGFELSPERGAMVVDAVQGVAAMLRPRIAQVSRNDRIIEVRNFIGSVRMSDGAVLEVEPKVAVDGPWASAIVQLLKEDSRISVTGSQRSRPSGARHDLTAVIAFEYARRLERALLKDGPLQVFERHALTSRRLNGQLDVSRYAYSAWRDPVQFPIRRDELTVANDFTRGLSLVSRAFRQSVSDTALSSKLRRLESAVIPGHPAPAHLNPAAASRHMPAQWASYRPAWDIAAAILRNRSLINAPGHSVGLEVAVEPWPLLETLLERTLEEVERVSPLRWVPKQRYPILTSSGVLAGEVEPDGLLENAAGDTMATFEAKYTRSRQHPSEKNRYQALATAAVLQAPLAVLVYAGTEPVKLYEVHGFNGRPAQLATVGLDMYGYERDFGAKLRAEAVIQLMQAAGSF